MWCWKVRWILQYNLLNKLLFPEKFAHHVLLLFYLFREEKELVFHQCMKTKKEVWVQDLVNINKTKFEPYGDLVVEVFLQFNKNLINNQDPKSEI